jgi:hypothetical protein
MGLVGSLWNPELQARLQRIHRHIARQAASAEPRPRPVRPHFQRRRAGMICDAIVSVLAEHGDGQRVRDITAAVTARLGEPVSPSSIKSCLWREARSESGVFEQTGRGRYRLRGLNVDDPLLS